MNGTEYGKKKVPDWVETRARGPAHGALHTGLLYNMNLCLDLFLQGPPGKSLENLKRVGIITRFAFQKDLQTVHAGDSLMVRAKE